MATTAEQLAVIETALEKLDASGVVEYSTSDGTRVRRDPEYLRRRAAELRAKLALETGQGRLHARFERPD